MMWPIFWPTDTDLSNPANTRHPPKTWLRTVSTSPPRSRARNSQRQADIAPEAMLSLVTDMAIPSGLKPSVAQKQRTVTFPTSCQRYRRRGRRGKWR